MAKGLSPTQRTLAALRDRGILCDIVERYIRWAVRPPVAGQPQGPPGIRKDFLGFGDILGVEPGHQGAIAIQSCGGSGYAAHLTHMLDSECTENVLAWLKAGNRLELWAWRKVKLVRGGKAMRWAPKVTPITLADFAVAELKPYPEQLEGVLADFPDLDGAGQEEGQAT